MEQNKTLFEKSPVKKAVMQMAIPTIITSLVVVIYNMADTYFVGQTQDPLQVAAVSLANPIFVMFLAISQLLGIGGSAIISIFLGGNKRKFAKQSSAFACYTSLILGAIFGIFIVIFMDPILKLLGATQETYQFSKDYLFYIAIGGPFVLFSNAFGHVIRGEGAAKASMIGGMIGTIINIILDPILILFLNMGTAGAAIATVIGNIAGTLYYIYYFKYRSPLLTISPKYFSLSKEVAGNLTKLGIPAAINSGLMSISTVFLNNVLLIYGNNAVAAMGIVTKIYLLIVLVHMGIANGIQPLLGYCYGAKLKDRFKSIMRFSALFSIIVGIFLTVIYIGFNREIISLFISDNEVIEFGAAMLTATSLAGPILGIMFLSINGMQALNNPLPATILSLARQGVLFIPLLFVLNSFFGLTGVNLTQTVADYISIVLGVIFFYRSLKKQ